MVTGSRLWWGVRHVHHTTPPRVGPAAWVAGGGVDGGWGRGRVADQSGVVGLDLAAGGRAGGARGGLGLVGVAAGGPRRRPLRPVIGPATGRCGGESGGDRAGTGGDRNACAGDRVPGAG